MRERLARIAEDLAEALSDLARGAGGDAILLPPREPPPLEVVAEAVRGCTKCGLYRTRTLAVPGEGNPTSPLLVVGEAPGAEEDRTGRPFAGPAGELLTRMLFAANIDRKDVFIANVLKCRPPNNRDPSPEEAAACRGHLDAQIRAIRPKVILTLGRHSAQLLLGTTTGITALRGREHVHRWPGGQAVVLPTFHPSYLLRTPAAKRDAWADMQTLNRLLRRETGDYPPPLDEEKIARLARSKPRG